MLTADLLRVTVRKGRVYPKYLDTDDPEAVEKADELVSMFAGRDGRPRGEIDGAVKAATGHGTDFLIWRGLAKLLYDRSEFETVAAVDPVDVRRVVFETAADHAPVTGETRERILKEVAENLEISVDEVERALYADLDERQRLVEFEAITAEELLDRYNLALAQAVLYRAIRLEVELLDQDPNKIRYLFQLLKFHRLMHRARRTEQGYHLTLDGPASLFKKSRKYGLQMAVFLPALLLAEDWQMTAVLDWKGDGSEQTFELSSDDGLVSHYRARGQWVAEEERWFEERFEQLESGWNLERRGAILELSDGEVLIPDYTLTDPDGNEVFVEIVGFWRFGYLERRIDMLDDIDEPLVLVVGERLKTDRKKLEDAPPEVFFFKGVILADRVLESAKAALRRQE